MKHIVAAAILLMTSASAFAAPTVSSNFEDPNNKFSELGRAQKKPCPLKNASGSDVANARLIHAVSTQVKKDFNERAKETDHLI